MPGHHAEEDGGDRRHRGEEPLRIANRLVKVAGKDMAIDVVAHRFAGEQAPGGEAGHVDVFECGPISHEQPDGGQELVPRPGMERDQGGKQIAQADASQHARKADVREIAHELPMAVRHSGPSAA